MKRPALCLALLLAGAMTAKAQAPDAPSKLTLRPAAAPTPALKYVLLPDLADMRPGNAALHYQRAHSFEWWDNLRRQPYYFEIADWLDRPFKDVPRDKVDFVRGFNALKEVDLGARRESCDWEMTERVRKEGIFLLVPDLQGFREYATLLAMRCRLQIADGDYPKAVYTLQTGMALGRHVAEAPLLLNSLVGSNICYRMLDRVEELIQTPKSPNLYWALTNLPRPLIDLRKPMQGDRLSLEAAFPDLRTIESEPLSPQAQQRLLKKLNDPEFRSLFGEDRHSGWQQKFGFLPAALKAYPGAKRALIAQGWKAAEVEAMPVLQVILIDALQQYRRLSDDALKWVNVPYAQARARLRKLDHQIKETEKEHPGASPFLAFVPHIQRVYEVTLRLERRVAALRCVEALRLYAAAHGGKLPAKLSDISEVPVPDDPVTGKGFIYQVDGDRVTLRDPPLAGGQPALFAPLHYELTFQR
jgi:hypothetical protein